MVPKISISDYTEFKKPSPLVLESPLFKHKELTMNFIPRTVADEQDVTLLAYMVLKDVTAAQALAMQHIPDFGGEYAMQLSGLLGQIEDNVAMSYNSAYKRLTNEYETNPEFFLSPLTEDFVVDDLLRSIQNQAEVEDLLFNALTIKLNYKAMLLRLCSELRNA